jgi:hypothetical protein
LNTNSGLGQEFAERVRRKWISRRQLTHQRARRFWYVVTIAAVDRRDRRRPGADPG